MPRNFKFIYGSHMTVIDVDLLNRHKAPREELQAYPGCFTNWLGLVTDASMFGSFNEINGKIYADIPTGGDGVYGGYPEYASFLTAIEQTSGRDTFTAVELGAGWGPWISGAGKVCSRLGFNKVKLVGVEADEEKCRLMAEHMARNRLNATILKGAAWKEDAMLKFPSIHRQDHGAAASESAELKDYRGFDQTYVDVPGLSLNTICKDLGVIDYMHWDIQGAELELALCNPSLLNERVRFLFIGTHSRPIEGRLIEFFYKNQWDLLYQNPCSFEYNRHTPSIEGMTRSDGELFLRNPLFSEIRQGL
jgi:FkbM family methyltransferase